MDRTFKFLIPVIVATTAAVAIGALSMSHSIAPKPASAVPIRNMAELAALEQMAEAACRCERAAGKPGACWTTYRERTTGLESVEMASACAPVSTEVACFMVNGKESCIVTARNGTQLCSASEGQAFEAAYNGAMKRSLRSHPGDMDRASMAADLAAERVLAGIRKGIVPPADPSSQGCS